jgi:transposase
MKKNTYTKEFKIGTVKMVLQEKKSANQVANDLGISWSTLSQWIHNYNTHGDGAFPGKGSLTPHDDEIRRLRSSLRQAEMERDLLKKTIAFFAAAERKSTGL